MILNIGGVIIYNNCMDASIGLFAFNNTRTQCLINKTTRSSDRELDCLTILYNRYTYHVNSQLDVYQWNINWHQHMILKTCPRMNNCKLSRYILSIATFCIQYNGHDTILFSLQTGMMLLVLLSISYTHWQSTHFILPSQFSSATQSHLTILNSLQCSSQSFEKKPTFVSSRMKLSWAKSTFVPVWSCTTMQMTLLLHFWFDKTCTLLFRLPESKCLFHK